MLSKKSSPSASSSSDSFNHYFDRFKGKIITEESSDVEKIPTYSRSLNSLLGGGIVPGKIIEVFGHDGSGKSTVCLNLISYWARKYPNKCFFYFDAEGGICSKEYIENLGLNLNNIFLINSSNGDEVFEHIFFIMRNKDTFVIVLDSVASLQGEDVEDETIGAHARFINKSLRKFLYYCSLYRSEVILILINQLRSKINEMWKGEMAYTTTGGKSIKYYCSLRLELDRESFILDKETRVGFYVRFKVVKSRYSVPFSSCKIPIIYGKGYSSNIEMIDYLIEKEIIVKKGNWYSLEHKDKKYSFNSKMDLIRSVDKDKDLSDLFKIYFK